MLLQAHLVSCQEIGGEFVRDKHDQSQSHSVRGQWLLDQGSSRQETKNGPLLALTC